MYFLFFPTLSLRSTFPQRTINMVIKALNRLHRRWQLFIWKFKSNIQSWETLEPWCHFVWIIPFIWLCTFKSQSFDQNGVRVFAGLDASFQRLHFMGCSIWRVRLQSSLNSLWGARHKSFSMFLKHACFVRCTAVRVIFVIYLYYLFTWDKKGFFLYQKCGRINRRQTKKTKSKEAKLNPVFDEHTVSRICHQMKDFFWKTFTPLLKRCMIILCVVGIDFSMFQLNTKVFFFLKLKVKFLQIILQNMQENTLI